MVWESGLQSRRIDDARASELKIYGVSLFGLTVVGFRVDVCGDGAF